jgi:hypothetical protein
MGKINLDEHEVSQLEITSKTAGDIRQLQQAQALPWLSKEEGVSKVLMVIFSPRRSLCASSKTNSNVPLGAKVLIDHLNFAISSHRACEV